MRDMIIGYILREDIFYPEFNCTLCKPSLRDSYVQGKMSGTTESARRRDRDGDVGTSLLHNLLYSEIIHCLR